MVEAHAFAAATGLPIPPSPITAATHAEHGLPWFDYRRSGRERIDGIDALRGVETVSAEQGVDVPGFGLAPPPSCRWGPIRTEGGAGGARR